MRCIQEIVAAIRAKQPKALCVDIDGTLAEFTLDPRETFIAPEVLASLAQLQARLFVGVITGRTLKDARRLLEPHDFPVAASYGLEGLDSLDQSPSPKRLAMLQQDVVVACERAHLDSEIKTCSVAVHYRRHPERANEAWMVARTLAQAYPEYEIKPGKFVYELAPPGANKGQALSRLIEQAGLQDHPVVYLGDDASDEEAFRAAQRTGGVGVKVGRGETAAQHRIDTIKDSASLLRNLADHWHKD